MKLIGATQEEVVIRFAYDNKLYLRRDGVGDPWRPLLSLTFDGCENEIPEVLYYEIKTEVEKFLREFDKTKLKTILEMME